LHAAGERTAVPGDRWKTVVAGDGRERTIDRVNIDTFVRDGYVAVRGAFDERIAGACRDMIWDSLGGQGISRADRATWTRRGTSPRMMAQPGVEVPGGFALDGSDSSPVARAIVEGLAPAS
jgi:hypothetical protein